MDGASTWIILFLIFTFNFSLYLSPGCLLDISFIVYLFREEKLQYFSSVTRWIIVLKNELIIEPIFYIRESFNVKSPLWKSSLDTIWPIIREISGFRTFPKGISPNVNGIEF